MIIFPGSCEGAISKMLIHGVNAESIFPIAQSFHISEREIPPGSSIGLGKSPVSSHLVGYTYKLFYRPYIPELSIG